MGTIERTRGSITMQYYAGCLVVLLPFLPLTVNPWLWRPVFDMRHDDHTTRRFTLLDVACLSVQLSLICAAIAPLGSSDRGDAHIPLWVLVLIPSWLLACAIWSGGVQSLANRCIKRAAARIVYLLVPLPLAYVGVFVLPFVALGSLFAVINREFDWWPWLGIAAPFIGFVVCRRTCLWVSRQAEPYRI